MADISVRGASRHASGGGSTPAAARGAGGTVESLKRPRHAAGVLRFVTRLAPGQDVARGGVDAGMGLAWSLREGSDEVQLWPLGDTSSAAVVVARLPSAAARAVRASPKLLCLFRSGSGRVGALVAATDGALHYTLDVLGAAAWLTSPCLADELPRGERPTCAVPLALGGVQAAPMPCLDMLLGCTHGAVYHLRLPGRGGADGVLIRRIASPVGSSDGSGSDGSGSDGGAGESSGMLGRVGRLLGMGFGLVPVTPTSTPSRPRLRPSSPRGGSGAGAGTPATQVLRILVCPGSGSSKWCIAVLGPARLRLYAYNKADDSCELLWDHNVARALAAPDASTDPQLLDVCVRVAGAPGAGSGLRLAVLSAFASAAGKRNPADAGAGTFGVHFLTAAARTPPRGEAAVTVTHSASTVALPHSSYDPRDEWQRPSFVSSHGLTSQVGEDAPVAVLFPVHRHIDAHASPHRTPGVAARDAVASSGLCCVAEASSSASTGATGSLVARWWDAPPAGGRAVRVLGGAAASVHVAVVTSAGLASVATRDCRDVMTHAASRAARGQQARADRDAAGRGAGAATPGDRSASPVPGAASPAVATADVLAQAFAMHRSGRVAAAARLLAQYGFSTAAHLVTASPASCGDSVDAAVATLSRQLIDSRPAAGQGWIADETSATGSPLGGASGSRLGVPQLVRYTLEDKERKHKQLLEFLRTFHVWQVTSLSARRLLATHGEQLRCAAELSVHQGSGSGLTAAEGDTLGLSVMFTAMEEGVHSEWHVQRDALQRAGLTVQDVFYCKVSRVADLVGWLCNAHLGAGGSRRTQASVTGERLVAITHANEVVLLLMRSANEYRARHRGEYEYDKAGRRAGAAASVLEDPWWTCSDRFRGWVGALVDATHTALAELRDRRGGDARGHADDDTLDRTLGRQLAGLIDATLSGYHEEHRLAVALHGASSAAASTHQTAYENAKASLRLLVEFGLTEAALRLAAKHRHFETLVVVCDQLDTRNEDRVANLDEGVTGDSGRTLDAVDAVAQPITAASVGGEGGSRLRALCRALGRDFVEYLCAWYLQQGSSLKPGRSRYLARLLVHTSPEFASVVPALLASNGHKDLAGVYGLPCKATTATLPTPSAARSLLDASLAERRSALRSKTLASLGKLCAMHNTSVAEAREEHKASTREQELRRRCEDKLMILTAAERVGLSGGVSSPAEIVEACLERAHTDPRLIQLAMEVINRASASQLLDPRNGPKLVDKLWLRVIEIDMPSLKELVRRETHQLRTGSGGAGAGGTIAAGLVEGDLRSTLLYVTLRSSVNHGPVLLGSSRQLQALLSNLRNRTRADDLETCLKHVQNVFDLAAADAQRG